MENKILATFTHDEKVYTLEKKSDTLFVIRCDGKTLSIHKDEETATEKFLELEEELTVKETKVEEEPKKEEKAIKVKEEVDIEKIDVNSELAKMYNDNASVGSENLASGLPLLKVHTVGKSSTNILADGGMPIDGYFFYKPSKEQYKTVQCRILTISRGFYTPSLQDPKVKVFNQIVAGLIIDGMKPFLLFLNGKKLASMWKFGKEAAQYTRSKPVGIPMFALTINLSTHPEETKFGPTWIIDFTIEKNTDGTPKVITDPGEFQYVKDNVELIQETIEGVINGKTVVEEEETTTPLTSHQETVVDVDPEDIPF